MLVLNDSVNEMPGQKKPATSVKRQPAVGRCGRSAMRDLGTRVADLKE